MIDFIDFHAEDVDFELPTPEIISFWINDSIKAEKATLGGALNFIFCSDEYLYRLNMQYLQHDTYTDVITFPYSDEHVEGDIFISIDRVADNARDLGISFAEELHRVIIHGVLHLIGYDDLSDEDEAAMRQKENFYLQRLPL
jgi:probable rRNA maturation factor